MTDVQNKICLILTYKTWIYFITNGTLNSGKYGRGRKELKHFSLKQLLPNNGINASFQNVVL
jgi:hypothetical protein